MAPPRMESRRWRHAAAACLVVLAGTVLGSANAATDEFDGLFVVGKGILIAKAVAPQRYMFMVGSSAVVDTADPLYIVPEWGIGIQRPGYPSYVDSYASWSGNYTNMLGNGTVPTTIYSYNNLSTPLYSIARTNSNVTAGAPSLEGYWESADGWRQICLCTNSDRGACMCVRNKLLTNGTVLSKWALVVQNKLNPLTARAISVYGEKDQIYTLSNKTNTLTVTDGTSKQLVVNLWRTKPLVDPQAPPLPGLYRTTPALSILLCANPANTPAAALCFGTTTFRSSPINSFQYAFTVIETASPTGETTQLLASGGIYTTRWSDAAGTAKLQSYPGLTQVALVWFRTSTLQTILGLWMINGVPVTCSGDYLAATCVGTSVDKGVTSSISMTASGRGGGAYGVTYAMVVGSKAVSFNGVVTVSLDGYRLTPDLPAPK